jgi:hypothetical protein
MFQCIGTEYCLRLQGDKLFQVDNEVAGKKSCVGYMSMLEGILAEVASHWLIVTQIGNRSSLFWHEKRH